jgi:hypothetical protein
MADDVTSKEPGTGTRPIDEILDLRIEPELLDSIKDKAKNLNVQVATLARWCVTTGLFLFDLNSFVRSRRATEESAEDP